MINTDQIRFSTKKTQSIQQMIQQRLLKYASKTNCAEIYQRRCQQYRQKYSKMDIFRTSSPQSHQYQILLLLLEMRKSFMKLTQAQFQEVKQEMVKNCNQYRLQVKKIYELLVSGVNNEEDLRNLQRHPLIRQGQLTNLLDMKSKLTPYVHSLFDKIYTLPEFANITPFLNYHIEQEIILKKKTIRNLIKAQLEQKQKQYNYYNRCLHEDKSIKLHVIFEAASLSQYYFSDYMKLVEESILNKNLQIDIISCTNYHAIFGVLYVLGYSQVDIKREMYQIRYLFEQNKNIDEVYNSKQWMKTSVQQIRALLQKEWERSIDPFTQVELNLNPNDLNQVDSLIDQFEIDRQYISTAFQKIINYLSVSFLEASKLSKQKRKDRFEQLLNIGQYRKINQRKSAISQQAFDSFLTYTINLLMNIAEYIFKLHFQLSHSWDQEKLFKGMVIHSLVTSLKYRFYIFDVLNKAGLDRNITLSNFYEACNKKILLNFNCINTTQQRFSLINKITKPNMPLWGALMACCSMPYLLEQFASHREWQDKEKGDRQRDKADKLFKQYQAESGTEMNYFISANLISTLPLELMTNQRLINDKLSESTNSYIIQIAFAFDTQFRGDNKKIVPRTEQIERDVLNESNHGLDEDELSNQTPGMKFFQQIPAKMQGKRRFLNCFDVLVYACQYICCYCCNCSVQQYFKDLMVRMQTIKIQKIRINSHDNLILNLYYDTLIKLPLRIGTLDFYKINNSRPDFTDTIRQAEKVVEQLCDTIQVDPKQKGKIAIVPSPRATIQVSFHKSVIAQKQFYRFKFISYTKWRDFNFKYIVQYSINTQQIDPKKIQWQKVNVDHVDLKKTALVSNQFTLLLKYTYFQKNITSKFYRLPMKALQHLRQNPARAIFSLNYRQIYYAQQKIEVVDQSPIEEPIQVKSYFLPKSSKYCSNFTCNIQKLQYSLLSEQRSICHSCKAEHQVIGQLPEHQFNKIALIAMKCNKCKSNYCLKCKISNFITKRAKNQLAKEFVYECSMNQDFGLPKQKYVQAYTPILEEFLGEEGRKQSKCSYCQNFTYKIFYEQGISFGNLPSKYFCGLKICKGCLYLIG